MHQSVEMPRRLFDCLSHVVVAIEVEDIGDQVEGILVVLNICIKASEVEAVRQVIFIDLAEVLIATGRDKLDPSFVSKRNPMPKVQ